MAVRIWRYGRTLVAHGATWDFHPHKTRDSFADAYANNAIHAERDFGANPPQSIQTALHDVHLVERAYNKDRISPVGPDGEFLPWFRGDPRVEYFMHVDMSMATDNTGMSVVHYDLEKDEYVADLIHTIEKTKDWKLSFERIFHIIVSLHMQLGFRFAKVTFDSWQSFSTIERLINAGIPAALYSVDRGTEAYDTLIEQILLGKFNYYFQATFLQEMKELKLYKGSKYDHPPGGSKDTSDGVAGAVANCVSARIGLSLTASEVEAACHEERVFKVSEHKSAEGDTYFTLPDDVRLDTYERTRKRLVRIDATDDYMLMVIGWNDKVNQRLYVDEFLIWEDYTNQTTLIYLQQFVTKLLNMASVEAFSLNVFVPIELVNFLRGTGRRVSSPLTSRNVTTRGANRVAKTGAISDPIIRMMVSQMKKGNLSVPRVEPLIKDLKFMTDENQTDRKFVSALAGWTDFISREMTYGQGAHAMPRPTTATSAPINPSLAKMSPAKMPSRSGSQDIDRIRMKYHQQMGAPVKSQTQPGDGIPKRLPRVRRVRR